MRLLCLSDLHLRSEAVVVAIDRKRLSPFLAQIAATVAEFSPDAVGDGEHRFPGAGASAFGNAADAHPRADRPVVATLGNHEFWSHSFGNSGNE